MSGYPEELYNGKPPHVGGTSEEAADSMKRPAQTIRQRVLECIASFKYGATDESVERSLDMRHQTVSARRRELVLMGLVIDSGYKRKTTSGRKATVWVAKDKASWDNTSPWVR